MASLLEQYQAVAGLSSMNMARNDDNPFHSNSVSTQSVQPLVVPIFAKQRIDFSVPAEKTVYRLAICDKLIVLGTKDGTVMRIDLKHGGNDIVYLECGKSVGGSSTSDSIEDIFLDPGGRHILLAMRSGECLYFGRNSKRGRVVTRLKTHILSAVGWSQLGPEEPNGPALLGTAQGVIFETEFSGNAADAPGMFLSSTLELYWKQVCSLAQPEAVHIRGIYVDRQQVKSIRHCVVLIATPTRLYQFKGPLGINVEASSTVFQEIFLLDPEKPMTNFIELPGSPHHCCLAAYHSDRDELSSFAWLTEPGIYHADINRSTAPQSTLLLNPQLFAIPRDKTTTKPVSLVVTRFHILLQYPTTVKVLSKLNNAIISEEAFPDKYGKVMGICRDVVSDIVWAYSEMAMYRYRITNESREVWKMHLRKGDYDAALTYSQQTPEIHGAVKLLKADYLLEMGRFEESAELFADCNAPFEEVVLKFTRLRLDKPLRLLLLRKVRNLRRSGNFASQVFMITAWLMEIYLNGLAHLRTTSKEADTSYSSQLIEFRTFLADPGFADIFRSNQDFFCSMMQDHSDHEDYLFFILHLHDTKRLLEFHMERDNVHEALRVLATQSDPELIYQYSPSFLQSAPARTVDVWISRGSSLDSRRLLPLTPDGSDLTSGIGVEILRYLQHCVHVLGSLHPAVHNDMVNLYVQTRNEDALVAYLVTADEDFSRKNIELYDPKLALRLCMEAGLHRAAVHLFCTLGLYLDAVELALDSDADRAKEIANRDNLDQDQRKRLWLLIAKARIQQNTHISKATAILRESGDIIKIEDILPFFPDFTTIDDFKDAICASLEDYNGHISELKSQVTDATKDADVLRDEIQTYRGQCLLIKGHDVCFTCKQTILSQHFFVFPCKHHMHFPCLLTAVCRHLAAPKLNLVDELRRQLVSMSDQQDDTVSLTSSASGGLTSASATISRREMIKLELESLVAEECPFCGRLIISSIDLPFIAVDEYEKSVGSWC